MPVPNEAVRYFREKVPITPAVFRRIGIKYSGLAFTVSGYTKAEILNAFYETVLAAIEDGTTMEKFREDMNTFLEDKGYEGITNFQADNIFRTNIQTAYQVGHYERMTDPEVMRRRPYWIYDAVNDAHTRPSHAAMNGRVYGKTGKRPSAFMTAPAPPWDGGRVRW